MSHSTLTIEHSLFTIKSRLTPHTDSPSLDAQVLLAHITGKPRTWLLAHPEVSLTPEQSAQIELGLQKLESDLPLPYLLGDWEFFGLKFKVTPDVLIPRPETELLVETALEWLKIQPPGNDYRAVDIGTGSGCIAITLAVQCPDICLFATDVSSSALAVAHHNAKIHHVDNRITFLEVDLLNFQPQLPDTQFPITNFHIITANLPYIPTAILHTLKVYGREPTLALDGGPNGLNLIKRLLSQAVTYLTPGGLILLEIESTQGASVLSLASHYFPDAHIHVKPDLTGHDRLLIIQTSPLP